MENPATERPVQSILSEQRSRRARIISKHGSLQAALEAKELPSSADLTLSEALILGLLEQNVYTFYGVLGHGSTEIGEVLRIYQDCGLVKFIYTRNEVEASHAATALRWITGEKAAVITSIGPGALHALAGSIVPASDGIGVWYLFGDETTQDEGPNMQQIPGRGQNSFLGLCSNIGNSYVLHTPLALSTALRRGLNTVDHSGRQGPFFLLLPMNTQPAWLPGFNLKEFPRDFPPALGPAYGDYDKTAELLLQAKRVLVKIGGGGRQLEEEILELLELVDGMAVTTPIASGVVPYHHPRYMTVGGSKGSICGNYAMDNADLLVAIGTRAVCQSDSSRTGYPNVNQVININTDLNSAMHYNQTTALIGDASQTVKRLNETLRNRGAVPKETKSPWLTACQEKCTAWEEFKSERYKNPILFDERREEFLMTQPAAIKTATDWARANNVVAIFDSGDVQANGFQVVEDERVGQTYTDTGASYMGFAASAILATAAAKNRFFPLAIVGDGAFMMNPQILIDAVEHKAQGIILLLDNRAMGAIAGLQRDQYGETFATSDNVHVDYVAMAKSVQGVNALDGGRSPDELVSALDNSKIYPGLSLISLPVYMGDNELGGLGVFGRWNVGNWVEETQKLRHKISL